MSSATDLQRKLEGIWFREYSRARGIVGSSGFEHVFVGEINTDDGELSGGHNWVGVFYQERNKDINYMGYIRYSSQVGVLPCGWYYPTTGFSLLFIAFSSTFLHFHQCMSMIHDHASPTPAVCVIADVSTEIPFYD